MPSEEFFDLKLKLQAVHRAASDFPVAPWAAGVDALSAAVDNAFLAVSAYRMHTEEGLCDDCQEDLSFELAETEEILETFAHLAERTRARLD